VTAGRHGAINQVRHTAQLFPLRVAGVNRMQALVDPTPLSDPKTTDLIPASHNQMIGTPFGKEGPGRLAFRQSS